MSDPDGKGEQNLPTNWFELARYLISTKRGLRFIGFLMSAIALVLLLSIYFIHRDELEVMTNAGSISIKKGSRQNVVLMVSAAGSEKDNLPWVGTEIMVKMGDKVKIEASGRVHTALKKLIIVAQTDMKIEPSWVGTEGSVPAEESDWDYERNNSKLMPDVNDAHYGYGMLVAAIRNEKSQVQNKEPIRQKGNFTVKTNGELVLAVNDLLLNGNARDIYALPYDAKHLPYYQTKAKEEGLLMGEKVNSWSDATLNDKAYKLYKKRLETWENISKNNNWMVWYEDNVGAFSVSVTIN